MLGALSLSGISGSSSSLTQNVDLELVEQIIERAPRTATSFPIVYKAYGEVLEEHGLSPSTDAAYYQFLLKLGVIRAPTWGERWDLWKATNVTLPLKTTVSPRKKFPASAILTDVRSRLPFLASASSNLDEGFEGESYFDVETHVSRPSPRRQIQKEYENRSRSLVGYTPSQSVDYDVGTLITPVRTSTPVYAQDHRRSPPPLPPYSVSDVSEKLFDDSESRAESDLGTPKATLRRWDEEKAIADQVVEEMERRADEFFETGLMGRCWDVWIQSNRWVQNTTRQIVHVRDTILLRQTLSKWRDAHRHHLDLPSTAAAHYEHHLKLQTLQTWIRRLRDISLAKREAALASQMKTKSLSSSWKRWRVELGKVRTAKWEKDMKEREKTFVMRKKEDLQIFAFEKWKKVYRSRSADAFLSSHTQRRVFDAWRSLSSRLHDLNSACDLRIRNGEQSLLLEVFLIWEKKTSLRPKEDLCIDNGERRLIKRVWDKWQVVSSRQQLSSAFLAERVCRQALQQWCKALKRVKALDRKARFMRKEHDASIIKATFDTWALNERGRLLERVQAKRLLQRTWTSWISRGKAVDNLSKTATDFSQTVQKRNLHRTFSRWRSAVGNQKTLALQADLKYESRQKLLIFQKWFQARRKIEEDLVNADKARAFFLQREALIYWRSALNGKRQKAMIERRRLEDLREVFDRWRGVVQQKVEDERSIAALQKLQDKHLLARSLSKWTVRVIDIKSRELDVVEKRDFAIQHNALKRWTRAIEKHREATALMLSHIDIKTEDHLRRIFVAWKEHSRITRERRMGFERLEADKKKNLVRSAFERWMDRKRENDLVPLEEEVALRHEDFILFQVFDKWKARSRRLPAILFENTRVKRLAWERWRTAFPRALQLKAAAKAEERRLLEDSFSTWKEAARVKSAARVGRHRGRIRPSLDNDHNRRLSGTPNGRSSRLPSAVPDRPLSAQHYRTQSTNINPATTTSPFTYRLGSSSVSLNSEPAYSRLRSELLKGRRGESEEAEVVDSRGTDMGRRVSSASGSGSEVMRALKGNLPGR